MTPPTLPPDVFDALPPAVQAYIRYLEARLADLEARFDQNSTNSSKPPSSDGPHVKPAPPKTPSGKRRGGQPGHPRHDRVILPPDEVIDHKPTHCRSCQAPVAGDDPDPIVDQVIELPPQLRHVTHHRRHTLTCASCAALTTAPAVPAARTGFGPRLTAATAYLSGVGRLGKRAIRTLFADLCSIPVSVGVVSKLEATVSRALEPIHAAAHAHARGRDANVDETGWRQGKDKAWLWVAVTNLLTVFLIRPNRNRAAFDDLVGPTPGVLTTDRFGVYTHLPGDARQVCWAHLRRDFQAMIDRADGGRVIGEELLAHADILCDHWQKVRDGTRTRRWFDRTHRPWLRHEVRVLLERGAGCGCAKTAGVCRELLAIESSLWTFAGRRGVEPTNNAAERAVRHAVCWRKTSYGTDSDRGSRFVERVLTVVATCRQQGRGVLDFLIQALSGTHKPSLLPEAA
jgi:transposase